METREALPAHLLVKIESFSLLSECGIDKYETREFSAGNYKWKLIIYPGGHGTDEKDEEEYVSAYLAVADTKSLPVNWDVNVVFSICILNQMKCLHTLGRTRRFFAMKTEWGFSKFISKKMLTDPSSGYLVDDSCVFGAEVFVNEYNPAVFEERQNPTQARMEYFRFLYIGNILDLRVFTAGGRKWEMQVYPNGHEDGIGRYLSVYLQPVASENNMTTSPGEKVKASYTITVKNQLASDKHHKETFLQWFSPSDIGWGRHLFISLAELNDPNSGFLVKDGVLLELEMSVKAVKHWPSST